MRSYITDAESEQSTADASTPDSDEEYTPEREEPLLWDDQQQETSEEQDDIPESSGEGPAPTELDEEAAADIGGLCSSINRLQSINKCFWSPCYVIRAGGDKKWGSQSCLLGMSCIYHREAVVNQGLCR